MKEIEIPDNKTGGFVLGHPSMDEAKIGEHSELLEAPWPWEIDWRTRTIRYTDGAGLADELDAIAEQLRSMASGEARFTANAHAVAERQARIIEGWAEQVRA